jgi:5'-nucleotidase
MTKKKILITNDDGIDAIGILELVKNVTTLGEVFVVAPDHKLAGISGSITFTQPIEVCPVILHLGEQKAYKTTGTSADCVMLALDSLVGPVDIVLSGINDEPNVGDDIRFSGTLGACREAVFSGIPAIGISLEYGKGTNYFEGAAKVIREILNKWEPGMIPPGIFLNINVPNIPLEEIRGIKVVRQGKRQYKNRIHQQGILGGVASYTIEGDLVDDLEPDTENDTLKKHYIAITPMSVDETNYTFMEEIKKWNLKIM